MGTHAATSGKCRLSSDIGCDFIFLDGVIQAYAIARDARSVIGWKRGIEPRLTLPQGWRAVKQKPAIVPNSFDPGILQKGD